MTQSHSVTKEWRSMSKIIYNFALKNSRMPEFMARAMAS